MRRIDMVIPVQFSTARARAPTSQLLRLGIAQRTFAHPLRRTRRRAARILGEAEVNVHRGGTYLCMKALRFDKPIQRIPLGGMVSRRTN